MVFPFKKNQVRLYNVRTTLFYDLRIQLKQLSSILPVGQ